MPEEEVVDVTARYAADRANERISDHAELCEKHYEEISEGFRKNEHAHNTVMDKIDGLREDLHKYDMRAVLRWVGFGGAFLLLIGGFLLTTWPKETKSDDWRSLYKTKDGVDCCGIKDCRQIGGVTIKIGEKIVVFPGYEPTEITTIHPSHDGRNWVCTTGCGFIAGAS